MDIYSLLRDDHAHVHSLFAAIDVNEDLREKRRLFVELKHELDLHTQLEEELFYPELIHSPRTGDRVRHALHEHGEVKNALIHLDGVDVSDPTWGPQLADIRHRLDEHIKEEENQLFPQARQILSTRLEEDLLTRLRRRKDELMGHPTREKARETYEEARQKGREWSDFMQEGSRRFMSEQARHTSDQVHSVADALRQTAKSLDEQGQHGVSGYVNSAAGGLDRLASSLSSGDLNAMTQRAREFATEQPLLFLGGAFAAGFLLTRFLKAGEERPYPSSHSREWETPHREAH